MQNQPLKGKIAVVAGATRGAGRGIACMLGAAGATVYCTGRSVRGNLASGAERPETIEETAEMVTKHGGQGFYHQTDHRNPAQVEALAQRLQQEQGRLDILVNDVWGGDGLMQMRPFWELDLNQGFRMIEQAIYTHLITSRYLVPLMLPHPGGIVLEITDGDNSIYRGDLFYDLVKAAVIRLAYGMAQELKPHSIAALAVTPGFLRSEAMLTHFGVSESNWQDGAQQDPHFIASETPYFVGRAIAALCADPTIMSKSGGVYTSWGLSDEYGFSDVDGCKPHWGRYFDQHVAPLMGLTP